MKIVIDTNIIFSSLLSQNEKYLKLFKNYTFFAPNYLIYEIFKYKNKIVKYSNLSINEIDLFFEYILKNVYFKNENELSVKSLKIAYELCKDIDVKDSVFVALTLDINGYLLTGDKKLFNKLKDKNFNRLIKLEELI